MEMHERIKELRKEHLHLSQTEFGEKLGVSRSVINNIERNALARPDQKLSLIKLMCNVFNVKVRLSRARALLKESLKGEWNYDE